MTATPTSVAILSVMKLQGLGRRKALNIVDSLVAETDFTAYRDALISCVLRTYRDRFSITELRDAWAKSEEQLDDSRNAGIQTISFHDSDYPNRLRCIPDPPPVLFVKGSMEGLHGTKSLAVVGTREPTSYGEKTAKKAARTAAEAGFAVVSGLALGCDAWAHKGCLEVKGIGVAVMAHGLDKVYPAANRDLAERLLEKGGCLVSEYPILARPIRPAFAERDRIQSGLSNAVLVIETDEKGGTMNTVRFARAQKRQLACIAHPDRFIAENKTRGNQKLVNDGWATPIPDGKALAKFLNGIFSAIGNKAPVESSNNTDERQMYLVF